MTDLGQLVGAFGSLTRQVPEATTLVGVGWATVDTDRTLAALGDNAGLVFGAEAAEPALGARARVAWMGGVAIVVLEPSTEGRLAAALARRGEGIACLYVSGASEGAGSRPTALGRPGRILAHDRPWGPFVLLVGPTAD